VTGQAHVLAVAADGLGQLLLDHRDIHGVSVLVDQDRDHLGGRHGVDDELRGILVPQDDIDAFAAQFVGHRLHARAAHADAGADGVDALVARAHGDLGAQARIARRVQHFDDALADFRHFELEQARSAVPWRCG
jgi:hypothetical protein